MSRIISRKKISSFLTYYGILSIIIGILICFGWSYILNAIDEVKPYEKINIFFETYGVKENLHEEIYKYVKEKDETNLLYEVNIYQFEPENQKISTYYDSFGKNADILVLIEEDLVDMKEYIDDYYLELSDELLEETIGNKKDVYSYYQFNNKNYAIKIFDKDDTSYSYQKDSIFYQKDGKQNHNYYMLLNINSINIGKYNSQSKTNNALSSLTYLLGE